MSSEKKQIEKGYNKNELAHSASGQDSSRNGKATQHFESLKQKIRGVFEESASKTPNKVKVLQNNRMSIESMGVQGCLSSTSANGRTLQLFQGSNQYRSITNMQQRKEGSVESRKSQQRQSFKGEQQNMKQGMKRCATAGKTLAIKDINQQTFGNIQNNSAVGYLQSLSSSTTLCNPTFISS